MKHFVIVKNGIARIMEAQDFVTDPMDEVAKWAADDQAQVTSVREISKADIPNIRSITMRDAWEDDGTKISVNMTKARVNKVVYEVRPERDKRLAVLDIEHRMASGDAAKQTAIDVKAQTLRDIPTTIQPALDAITTPEALEAWQPTWPT